MEVKEARRIGVKPRERLWRLGCASGEPSTGIWDYRVRRMGIQGASQPLRMHS
jgi:hypothetical protein